MPSSSKDDGKKSENKEFQISEEELERNQKRLNKKYKQRKKIAFNLMPKGIDLSKKVLNFAIGQVLCDSSVKRKNDCFYLKKKNTESVFNLSKPVLLGYYNEIKGRHE